MTEIALRAATLTLCLTLSATSFSATQPAASQQADAVAKPSTADQPTTPTPDKDGLYRVGGSVVAPKLLHASELKIAKNDRKHMKWLKTTTLIQLSVDTAGKVQNAHVIKSSLESMKSKDTEAAAIVDQSCLDAVNQYRFAPATLNDKPVPVLLNIQVAFQTF